ncbi:MAG: HAD family hydrolase [Prevotella sp.]|nr:HAD family hydrolase [Prevotella sp.]
MKKDIEIIVFDADDTLWDCQGHFEQVMQQLYTMLEPWTDRETAARELFATERQNMPQLGYGTKAFTLSMMETAMRVSRYEMPARQLAQLQQLCYGLLHLPATPLPEVVTTLDSLQRQGRRMVVFTKGELLDQEHKLQRSGLLPYFEHVEITSDKGQAEFLALCRKLNVEPGQMMMVGNSLRSDIAPALAIGAWGVHIPFHVTWELEFHDDFEHPRLRRIAHFGELLEIC